MPDVQANRTISLRPKMLSVISDFSGPYSFLSNFEPPGLRWQSARFGEIDVWCVEIAYQAEKARNIEDFYEIAILGSPREAKRLGRLVSLRPDWENVKVDIMRRAVRQKFSSTHMMMKLMSTGDSTLVEGNYWHDNVWGDCRCDLQECRGQGQNLLGKMLMRMRQNIRDTIESAEE